MSMIDRIPGLSDAELKNLFTNASRLKVEGSAKQQAAAEEMLPALAAAITERKAEKGRALGAKATKRSAEKKALKAAAAAAEAEEEEEDEDEGEEVAEV